MTAPTSELVIKGHQRRKAERPQELLEAALDLFVEKGLNGTRTEEVARLAGVSKGTLYRYYPSKDALFKAVVRHYLTAAMDEVAGILGQYEGPTPQLLQVLAQTWWRLVGDSKASFLFVLIATEAGTYPELAQFYMDEVMMPGHLLLQKVVQRGIDRGEFHTTDITSVVQALIAPIYFVVITRKCAQVCSAPITLQPDKFIATQIELLTRGLETRP